MELGRRVPVDGPGTVVLEGRGDPFPGCLGRVVAADPRLNVPFGFIERHDHARPMGLAHTGIAADERGQRHAFRRRERRVPSRAMRHRLHDLATLVGIRAGRLVVDEELGGEGMLAVREPLELLLVHVAGQPPQFRQLAVPVSVDLLARRVVIVAAVTEFLCVIRVHLRGAQGLRDRQHSYSSENSCS